MYCKLVNLDKDLDINLHILNNN